MGTRTYRQMQSFTIQDNGESFPFTATFDRWADGDWKFHHLVFDDLDQFHELNDNDYNRMTRLILEAQTIANQHAELLNKEKQAS